MTVMATYRVTCDRCDTEGPDAPTVRRAVTKAAGEGWQPDGKGRDVCPNCLPYHRTDRRSPKRQWR